MNRLLDEFKEKAELNSVDSAPRRAGAKREPLNVSFGAKSEEGMCLLQEKMVTDYQERIGKINAL